MAQLLKGRDIPFIVVDLNIDNVDSAKRQAESALFGDVTSVEILENLGASHARMLVISINDHDATVRAISTCRSVAPELPIIARARFAVDVDPLGKAGATYVIDTETAAAGGAVNCVVENLISKRASV